MPLVDSASVVSASTATDAISLSVACTVANNANRVLVVAVGYRVPDPVRATIDGVTYGGVAMTLVGKSELTTQPTGSSLWRLVAPVVGTANVVATASASGGIAIGAMCVYDAHQSTFSAPAGNASESVSSAASTTVPSSTGELVVDSVAAYASPSLTAGTGQTQRSNVATSGSSVRGASSTADGAASVVMSWSLGTARRWAMVGWSIKPAGSATVPGAPTIGTATAGNAAATVAFSPPASNGGSAITAYTVTSTPGGFTATGAASPLTVTGLTNGTAYTFKVKATNAVGTGLESAASNTVLVADALITRVRSELKGFTDWCAAQGVRGYIGEIGWPWATDSVQWNSLAEAWFAAADLANLDVSVFSDGNNWGTHKLGQHVAVPNGGTVNTSRPSSAVGENHPQPVSNLYLRGSNLNGAEFGTGNIVGGGVFSNVNPGVVGTDYFYPSLADWQYIAGRGVKTVRFAFRWEILQPTLGGALNSGELGRLQTAVSNAASVGIKVIIEPHNYCRYWLGTSSTARTLLVMVPDGGQLNAGHLSDLWTRLSTEFASNLNVVAYGLINEPHGLASALGTLSGTIVYGWDDGTVQGWVPLDASATLTAITTTPQQGTGCIRTTKQVVATGYFDNKLSRPNPTLSGTGNALECWVRLNSSSPTTTWRAILQWQDNVTFTTKNADAEVVLSPGQWVRVPGNFTLRPIDFNAIDRINVFVYGNPTSLGTLSYDVDSFSRGSLSGAKTPVKAWEDISQMVVSAIRSVSDSKLIMVPGYQYSAVRDWTTRHPTKWITDSANNVAYEGHHYFDADASGSYLASYATEAASASTTPPTVESWVVDGSTLTIGYNEALDPAFVPTTSQFTVKVNGTTRTVSTVAVSGSAATLTLASPVVSTDNIVTVSYVQ